MAIAFATKVQVKRLVPFHYDPGHSDQMLDGLFVELGRTSELAFAFIPGTEGSSFQLGSSPFPIA